ncbi:hypothetical protein R2A130_2879 [Ahrensia sp. R2A130]|nr:hypothetical protein R2A130_2879 [Ahrensia sp. R2A130]
MIDLMKFSSHQTFAPSRSEKRPALLRRARAAKAHRADSVSASKSSVQAGGMN